MIIPSGTSADLERSRPRLSYSSASHNLITKSLLIEEASHCRVPVARVASDPGTGCPSLPLIKSGFGPTGESRRA